METYWHANGTYAAGTAAALRAIEPSLAAVTGGPTLANPTFSAVILYRIVVTSKTTNVFTITKAAPSGAVSRTCTRPNQTGGCRASGLW